MKLTDNIATHPKILRAGEILGGPTGLAEALALYVAAIGHARHFVTDGFITNGFVSANSLTSRGEAVAHVLSDRRVRLWHRVRGGYRIHDWADWNPTAADLKHQRALTRKRVAGWRQRHNGGKRT